MKLGKWSTTAGNNNTSPPDGWPEGQAPSTVNDCAREMMASIRTAFTDPQFVDQDITPTYVNATTFTVPGTQTSALHTGRRLKLFDAGNTQYAGILSSTATANTSVVISGTAITAALTSMAIGILESSFGNTGLPRNVAVKTLTASSIAVGSGSSTFAGPTRFENISVSAFAATGPAIFGSTVSISATIAAANIAKSWVRFSASGSVAIIASFNISAISRSAAGVYRINFNNAFADTNYMFMINAYDGAGTVRAVEYVTLNLSNIKFRTRDVSGSVKDCDIVCASFYR